MKQDNTLNWVALSCLILATILQHYWLWGTLFIYWSIYALRTGSIFLISTIHRGTNPALYWSICIFWLLFGVWYLTFDLLWRVNIHTLFGYTLNT